MINPTQDVKRPKRTVSVLVTTIAAGAALVLGVIIGGLAGGAADEPPATAQRPLVVASEVDTEQLAACQRTADELHKVAQASVDGVASPQNEVIQILITQLTNSVELGAWSVDPAEIDRGTAILEKVSTTAGDLGNRVTAATPDFQKCVE